MVNYFAHLRKSDIDRQSSPRANEIVMLTEDFDFIQSPDLIPKGRCKVNLKYDVSVIVIVWLAAWAIVMFD